MMTQPYELPLVRYDVCEPETMKDVIHSLDSLRMIMDNMFNLLEKNVVSERGRLTNIHHRLAACQSKVEAFKGSKKPTTVFSTAKFPGTDSFPLFDSIFQESEIPTLRCSCRDIDEGVQYLNADIRKSSVNNSELAVELQALLCRLHSCGSDIERVELVMEDEGLGPMPPMIPSVGSVLIFNSSTDPRKGYHTMDNLVSSGRPRASDEHLLESKPLASAPASLLLGVVQPDLIALDLTFKPTRGTVAALALPANLPLDFVADIQYSAAPSQASVPADHGYRSENKTIDAARTPALNPSAKEKTRKPTVSDTIVAATAPIPLKPPVSSMPYSDLSLSTALQTQTSLPTRAPPPPPARAAAVSVSAHMEYTEASVSAATAPASAPVYAVDPAASTEKEDAAAPAPSSGQKAGFLDAIKGMSVTSLRSSAAPRAATSSSLPVGNGPISMLDEMKERMRRRNSALTGKVDKEKQKRDQEIVNAARENNIFNLSLPSHIPGPKNAMSLSGMVSATPVKIADPVASRNVQNERDGDRGRDRGKECSDDSDNSSEDTYSVSEVSFDCAPPIQPMRSSGVLPLGAGPKGAAATLHTTSPVQPVTVMSAPPPPVHVPLGPPPAPLSAPRLAIPTPPQAPPPSPAMASLPAPALSAPVGRKEDIVGEGAGGGGGGGGLLDAARSSAVSNMLYSAKQNQAAVSDSSDDDWDD